MKSSAKSKPRKKDPNAKGMRRHLDEMELLSKSREQDRKEWRNQYSPPNPLAADYDDLDALKLESDSFSIGEQLCGGEFFFDRVFDSIAD